MNRSKDPRHSLCLASGPPPGRFIYIKAGQPKVPLMNVAPYLEIINSRISRELSEPERDFVVQQILLEPEFEHTHRVKFGDA